MLMLSYHEITATQTPYRYSVSEDRFAGQVRLAAQHGGVRFTFDDGHISQFQYGLPALEAYGAKGTFFVTAGWTGTPRMMDWPELRELTKLGHEVQAHGWQHRFMTECSPAELDQELRQPRETLEDRLGVPVDALSLPHGRWNPRVLSRCQELGYKRVFGSYPWFGRRERSRYPGLELIGRCNIVRDTSDEAFARMLQQGIDRQWLPRIRGTISAALRNSLGDRAYHRLWCLFARRDAADLPREYETATEPKGGTRL